MIDLSLIQLLRSFLKQRKAQFIVTVPRADAVKITVNVSGRAKNVPKNVVAVIVVTTRVIHTLRCMLFLLVVVTVVKHIAPKNTANVILRAINALRYAIAGSVIT